ncbi:uncharacterized protein LOC134536930 [Bacillus rossius redtenbacheri]|uniref:uncharacterized protein LOC134536930 n=1 Tax=Bacillus rossius redtenbacheri TaxID=93214 RepID=UPI002FDD5E80
MKCLLLRWCACALATLVFLAAATHARPYTNPEHALLNMRHIPQWHCLRYRRFDLVRRCRNHRLLDSRLLRQNMTLSLREKKLRASAAATVATTTVDYSDQSDETDPVMYDAQMVFVADDKRPGIAE